MGNRAIKPKDLAREIHAWDSAFGRHRKAGHPAIIRDVKAALKLLRKAERVLRKCVYEKRTLVRERVARFHCVVCNGVLEWKEFNDALVEKRVLEPTCHLCTRPRAHAASQDEETPAAPALPAPQEEQDTQEADAPGGGASATRDLS